MDFKNDVSRGPERANKYSLEITLALKKLMRPNNNLMHEGDTAALDDLCNHIEEYLTNDTTLLDEVRRYMQFMKVARRDFDEWTDMYLQFDEVNDTHLKQAQVSKTDLK